MPGLVVTTGVRVGAVGTTNAPASSFFIVGTAQRGPDDDYTLIESMAQAEAIYGGDVGDPTIYKHLQIFFEEGGTRAYVRRVVETSSVSPAVAAVRAAVSQLGSSAGILTVRPVGAGTWANGTVTSGVVSTGALNVRVVDGVITNTKRVVVGYGGAEIFRSSDCSTNAQLAAAINSNVPNYLVATENGSSLVANKTATVFAGGVNGTSPTDDLLVNGLASFLPELGSGVVSIPEHNGITIWDGIKAHAIEFNRIAFCAFEDTYTGDPAATPTNQLAAAQSALVTGSGSVPYYGSTASQQTDAGAVAFFWPHVTVSNGTGGTDIASPESFAAAARCRAHLQTGPWRPAAGVISASRFITGLIFPVNSVISNDANDARINPLRVVDGNVRIYGARSVSADESNWRYITYRDTMNYIVVVAEKRLEPYIFNVIDSRKVIFSDIAASLTNMLEPIRAAGGIYEGYDAAGKVTDRGYTVEVSDALNPQAQLASGIIAAKVGVRISSVGETINLVITKSNLTTGI